MLRALRPGRLARSFASKGSEAAGASGAAGAAAPQRAVPISWKNPGTWVDLELERHGISHKSGPGFLASPWPDRDADLRSPDSNVLWPNPAIEEHRSRPFVLPQGTQDSPEAQNQLKQNRARLVALWDMSSSHGISWDELDAAYVDFSKRGKMQQHAWAHSKVPSEENTLPPPPEAKRAKDEAMKYAERYLSRFCRGNPQETYPTRTRRLAARRFIEVKRQWFGPWRAGKLQAHLRHLVTARMLRRETEERSLGLRGKIS